MTGRNGRPALPAARFPEPFPVAPAVGTPATVAPSPVAPVSEGPAAASLAAVAIALAVGLAPAAAGAVEGQAPRPGALELRDAATGTLLETVSLPEGRWCLAWRHSVTGDPVADCFAHRPGLVLERSYLPDHAAGLGETPGRGHLHSLPGGGYVIEGIGLPLPRGLALRVGRAAVDHRITVPDRDGATALALSARHPGRRLRLLPAADPG